MKTDNRSLFKRFFGNSGSSSRKDEEDSLLGPGKDPYHGRSYHKYFEGYTEYPVTDAKGNVKIKRVYTAPYYRPDLPEKKYIGIKALYFLLTVFSTVIYGYAMLMGVPSNFNRIVAFLEALSLAALFFFFIFLASYIIMKPTMTVRTYRRIKTMQTLARASIGSRIAVACATLVFVLLAPDGFRLPEFFCTLLILVSAALLALICLIEKKLVYKEVPNNTKVDDPDALLIERLH